jgi:hypothetical protein
MKEYILLKTKLITTLLLWYGYSRNSDAQEPKMKLGAYYFGGWSGKCPYDDGKPEHAWAKGLPTHATKSLVTEFAGREIVWGWWQDYPGNNGTPNRPCRRQQDCVFFVLLVREEFRWSS